MYDLLDLQIEMREISISLSLLPWATFLPQVQQFMYIEYCPHLWSINRIILRLSTSWTPRSSVPLWPTSPSSPQSRVPCTCLLCLIVGLPDDLGHTGNMQNKTGSWIKGSFCLIFHLTRFQQCYLIFKEIKINRFGYINTFVLKYHI